MPGERLTASTPTDIKIRVYTYGLLTSKSRLFKVSTPTLNSPRVDAATAPLDEQLRVPRTCLQPSTKAIFLVSFNKYVGVSQRMLLLNVLPVAVTLTLTLFHKIL